MLKIKTFEVSYQAERIVIKTTIHPDYVYETKTNDLAILEIDPVQFSQSIRPICLPGPDPKDLEGVKGIVVGFGWINAFGNFPELLMQAEGVCSLVQDLIH